jgi:succinate dehydrogenase / fumarate reductase cytochrome b subunit
MGSPQTDQASKRPLSPHLQVYKLPYNAVMSIAGRAVGIALFIALSVILMWGVAVIWNPPLYAATMEFLNTPAMHMMMTAKLLIGAFAVFFYLGNGIRHVIWDASIGVNVKFGEMTGHIVLIVSAVLTVALAFVILGGAS